MATWIINVKSSRTPWMYKAWEGPKKNMLHFPDSTWTLRKST